MFEGIIKFFKKFSKNDDLESGSKDTAKERLHLVLMQDRANVSADFIEMMKQEIIEVIKKYIEVDEKEIDVKLTNKTNEDGSIGAPALYANIPISKIKNDNKQKNEKDNKIIENKKVDEKNDDIKFENIESSEKKQQEIKNSENNQNNQAIQYKEEKNLNKNQEIKEKDKIDKLKKTFNNTNKSRENNNINKKISNK